MERAEAMGAASSPIFENGLGGRCRENLLVAVGELVVVVVDWLHLDPVAQLPDIQARCRVDGSVDHLANRGHPVDSIDLEIALPTAVFPVVDVAMAVHQWRWTRHGLSCVR